MTVRLCDKPFYFYFISFGLSRCLPDLAWVGGTGNLAELAYQVSKVLELPNKSQQKFVAGSHGHPVVKMSYFLIFQLFPQLLGIFAPPHILSTNRELISVQDTMVEDFFQNRHSKKLIEFSPRLKSGGQNLLHLMLQGGNSMGFFEPEKWPQFWPKKP